MRIWLIGADVRGSEILRQLHKNANIEVIVSDAAERPRAVVDKVIDRVNYVENVTSVNINHLAFIVRSDIPFEPFVECAFALSWSSKQAAHQ